MDYQEFTSEDGLFTLKIPAGWAEYEVEEGTYAFFDTTRWTGNLRVTPLQVENEDHPDAVNGFIDDEYQENKKLDPVKREFDNGFLCVSYKKPTAQGDDIIYYWVLRKMGYLFICSFTIDAESENTAGNKSELEKVENIIESIQII